MTGDTETTPSVAVIVDRYPALEQPFVAEELKGLEARGLRLEIWSLRRTKPGKMHPVQNEVAGRLRYLPDSLSAQPLRTGQAVLSALGAPGMLAGLGAWMSDLMRAPGPERLRYFGQACALYAEAGRGVRLFYAIGLGHAGAVARIAARLRGAEWACRIDEPQVWDLGDADKADRLESAAFCVAPSEFVAHHVRPYAPGLNRVVVMPPAIDAARFGRTPVLHSQRVGDTKDQAVRIVSIGRLEEGSGYRDLLAALSDLPKATYWRFVHIGDGSIASKLRQFSLDLGLGPLVIWKGLCDQAEVLAALREADIYVQSPRAAAADRWGLPHALIEAASQSLPVVSPRVGATAGFLVDEENALLVRPGHVPSLTEAIQRLVRDPDLRAKLGGAGRRRVEQGHNLSTVLDEVAGRMRMAMV